MAENLFKSRLVKLGITLFLTYMSVALALPVVSVFVTEKLQLSNWLGGLAVGISFVATILSRKFAGKYADLRSSRRGTLLGIGLYVLAAVLCLLAAWNGFEVMTAFIILLGGRLCLGFGESMTMVGISNWSFILIGAEHSGRILSVIGMAMYGAFAAGAPLGLFIYEKYGFMGVMLASLVMSLLGAVLIRNFPEVSQPVNTVVKRSFLGITRQIWREGMVVCLQGVGFAVIGAFVSLYFMSSHWPYAGLGLVLFGAGFVFCRVFFGGLPDRIGGVKVALVSMLVETLGQLLLWLAPEYEYALLGALLTGLGCSMIFPAMGSEVVKRVAPELRGTAFGAFAMFQDVAYAFSAPLAGYFADQFGYPVVFTLGFIAASAGLMITSLLYLAVIKRNKLELNKG